MESGHHLGLIYGLEFQCRSLCPVASDTDCTTFIVGTQGLKITNQIHVVRLNEDTRTLTKTIYQHPKGEIWEVSSSHGQGDLFSTRHSQVDGSTVGSLKVGGSVWRFPGGDDLQNPEDLELVCDLKSENKIDHISWKPSVNDCNKIMVLANNTISLHDIATVQEEKLSTVISSGQLEGKHGHDRSFSTGAWNPHQNCQQYATANEHQVRGWDVRSMSQVWHLESPAHCGVIRCIDFNPNKQYTLATSGDDGAVRFWDVRNPKLPLTLRSDHSHWVWSVKYNQFHDQLLLTSSSDGRVVLSSMTSISSEASGHLEDDEDDSNQPPLEDGVIQVYDDHEDSVYVVEWSSADPWTFASLSFDGRLVINSVPKSVKFNILNLI